MAYASGILYAESESGYVSTFPIAAPQPVYQAQNQCSCMARHLSSTVFRYTVYLTIWGGGVATPEIPPLNPPMIRL